MKVKSTNNGKKGGLLKGKPHYDKDGNSLGGIKAIVTDTKQIVELEGGEVIINKEASKKHWKELSKINQSAGDGVPILPPSKMKKGGELEKGIKTELEHSKTIKKIAKEDLTPKEGATLIAKDHLAESDKYYSDLKKMESKFKSGGTLTEEDKKEIYKKWVDLVNMSSSELKKFMDSEEGKKAGLSREQANKLGIHYGRQSARWILRMKATPRSSWTPTMWEWANRQISFNSRMRGNEGALYDEKGNKTRKHLSLLIWGHNPKKYEQGGELIKRADGSYSKRGLWDNIRDNVGSGKKPTKEMLKQEAIIRNKYKEGGVTGDVFSIKDPEQFKQIITLYNKFSEKFNVDNYFLNDNSVVFLRKVKFTPIELKQMSKHIADLSKNQNFDIISDKKADISNGYFKFFLKDRVRYSQGGLIAPNGKESNLTAQQYKLVRTDTFKKWFGDWENSPETASKVVDENGEPLVVWHGTKQKWWNDYFVFNPQLEGASTNVVRRGFGSVYFTSKKEVAETYGSVLVPTFLNFKNPIEIDANYRDIIDVQDELEGIKYENDIIIRNTHDVKDNDISKKIYSNIFITTKYFGAIKLADGTNTTFDSSNPDIRFEDGGEIDGYAQQLIDIISINPKLEQYQKYKVILKDRFGINFDDFYKDDYYIENANLSEIKDKDDFINYDKYIEYAKKIFRLRGLIKDYHSQNIEGVVPIEKAIEIGKKLNFIVKHKEYDGGSGNYASHSIDTITMPNEVDINAFIHEIGHHYDHFESKEYKGLANTSSYASSLYEIGRSDEVFAENFKNYFVAPNWLKENLPMVYDELDKNINDVYKKEIHKLIADNSNPDIRFEDGGRVAKEISFEEVKKLINSKEYVKVGQSFIENRKAIYTINPSGTISEKEYNPNFLGGVRYKTIARKNKFEDGGLMENEPPRNFENKLWNELSDRYEEGGNINSHKITCANCKHSWHSHESEEHDTHVCHKCGHDNKEQIKVVDYKTIKNIDKVDKMENSDIFYNEDIFVSHRDYILGGFNSQQLNKIKVVDDKSMLNFTKLESIFTDRLENAIEIFKNEIKLNVLDRDEDANIEQEIYDDITNCFETYLEIKAEGISAKTLTNQIKNHSAYITWSNKIKDRVNTYKDRLKYTISDVNINRNSDVTVNEAEEYTYNSTFEEMLEQLFNINQENNI